MCIIFVLGGGGEGVYVICTLGCGLGDYYSKIYMWLVVYSDEYYSIGILWGGVGGYIDSV